MTSTPQSPGTRAHFKPHPRRVTVFSAFRGALLTLAALLIALSPGAPTRAAGEPEPGPATGRLDEIVALLASSAEAGPAEGIRHLIAGIREKDRVDRLREYLADAAECAGDPLRRGRIRYHLGRIYILGGEYEKGLDEIEIFLKANEDPAMIPLARAAMASAYLALERKDLAMKTYREIFADSRPDDLPAGLWKAYAGLAFPMASTWDSFSRALNRLLSSMDVEEMIENCRNLLNSHFDLDIMESDMAIRFYSNLSERAASKGLAAELDLSRALVYNFDVDDFKRASSILGAIAQFPGQATGSTAEAARQGKEGAGGAADISADISAATVFRSAFVLGFTAGFLDPSGDRKAGAALLEQAFDVPGAGPDDVIPAEERACAGFLAGLLRRWGLSDPGAASGIFEKVCSLGADHIATGLSHLYLARILEEDVGDLDAASEHYSKVVEDFARTAIHGKAKSSLLRISRRKKGDAAYLYSLASNYYKLSKPGRAIEIFEDLIARHPSSPEAEEAHFSLARILADDLLDSRRGIEKLEEFIRIHPDSAMVPRARFKIANVQEYLGNYREAMEIYDFISTKVKDRVLSLQALGRKALILEKEYRKFQDAVTIHEEIIRRDPNGRLGDESRFRLAGIFRDGLKKETESRAVFRRILADPDSLYRGPAYAALYGPAEPTAEKDESGKEGKKEDGEKPAEKDSPRGSEKPGSKDAEGSKVKSGSKETPGAKQETGGKGPVDEGPGSAGATPPPDKSGRTGKPDRPGKSPEAPEPGYGVAGDSPAGETLEASGPEEEGAPESPLARAALGGEASMVEKTVELVEDAEARASWDEASSLLLEAAGLAVTPQVKTSFLLAAADLLEEKAQDPLRTSEVLREVAMTSEDPVRVRGVMTRIGRILLDNAGKPDEAASVLGKLVEIFGEEAGTAEALALMGDIEFRYSSRVAEGVAAYRRAVSAADDPEVLARALKGLFWAAILEPGLVGDPATFLKAMADGFPARDEGAEAMYHLSRLASDDERASFWAARLEAQFPGSDWTLASADRTERSRDRQRIAKYTEFIRSFPTSAELPSVYYRLGLAHLRLGEISDAAKVFRAISQMYPGSPYGGEIESFFRRERFLSDAGRLEADLARPRPTRLREDLMMNLAEIRASHLADLPGARVVLRQFLYLYPGSPMASQARDMLKRCSGFAGEGQVNSYLRLHPSSPVAMAFLYDRALARSRAGDHSGAAESWEEFLRRFPSSWYAASARESLAGVLEKQTHDYRRCSEVLAEMAENEPEPSKKRKILERLADVYSTKLKDGRAALASIRRVIPLLQGADAAKTSEKADRAAAGLEIAEVRRRAFEKAGLPEGREAFLSLSDSLESRGLHDLAAAQLTTYLELFPEHDSSRPVTLRLARLQDRLGKTLDAIRLYRDYIQKAENAVNRDAISLRIAMLLIKAGRADEAAKHVKLWSGRYTDSTYRDLAAGLEKRAVADAKRAEEAGEKGGEFKRGARYEGVAADDLAIDLERYSSAMSDEEVESYKKISDLQAGVLKDPGATTAPKDLRQVSEIYEKNLELYDKALEYLERIIRFYPDYAESGNLDYKAAELAEEKAEDFEKALKLYRRYFDRSPSGSKGAFVCFKLAQLNQYRIEDFEAAREYYDRVFESYPDSEWEDDALYSAGLNYSENLRDYPRAIELLTRLIEKYYDSEFSDDAQFRIGMIYENNLNDFSLARDAYRKVIDNYSSSQLYSEAQNGVYRMDEYIQRFNR